MNNASRPSKAFRNAAVRSVFSILLFVVTYLLLVALAIALTIACGFAGIWLIMLKPMWATLAVGGVLIIMGTVVLAFVFKFIAKKNKTDRSHLIEANAGEHPELFKMIGELVKEVGTRFPKKVYFSTEVNAAVFYDSTFWSMFFPVRKNLQIGIGLMNAVTVTEMKAILAHEFGHFSQRSMKVGSYVYNVNRVLYNLLYDNEGYNNLISSWANVHWTLNLGVTLAVKIIQSIQAVLRQVYQVLNTNYYDLSREMEFHADAIAASAAGSVPLAGALMRLSIADQALSSVLDFYNEKIAGSAKATNFYPQQGLVMNYFADKWKLQIDGGLPQISLEDIRKFKRTKLELKDQWASHPSTEDRVMKLMMLDMPAKSQNKAIAMTLLTNGSAVQELLTEHAFRNVSFEEKPISLEPELFWEEFLNNQRKFALPDLYRGYFDRRDPYLKFNDESFKPSPDNLCEVQDLLNDELLEDLKSLDAMTDDLQVLRQIRAGEINTETFDYDGQRYQAADCDALIGYLEDQVSQLNARMDETDRRIFECFSAAAATTGRIPEWKEACERYQMLTNVQVEYREAYVAMANAASYMQSSYPFTTIIEKTGELKKFEEQFKQKIGLVLRDERFAPFVNSDQRLRLEEYCSKELTYFVSDMYLDNEVSMLYATLEDFYQINMESYLNAKRDFLIFQTSLLLEEQVAD